MVLITWIDYILERILSNLNEKRWEMPLPPEVAHLYEKETFLKAKQYNKDKLFVSKISTFISTAIMIAFLLYGVFGKLHLWISGEIENTLLQSLLFFLIVGAGSSIISLPFSIYNTFIIEEKYGFNTTTVQTYIADLIKGMLLSVILGGGILGAIIWFYEWQAQYFWLYAWALISGISLFMAMFYTSIFVPLFNKLQPLEDGSLKIAIEKMADKTGYPLQHVYILDASKRSKKANAYFSGFGPQKTIVLFDTLLSQMTEEEVVAVLAHEIGHYKKKHIIFSMLTSIVSTGVMLFLLSLCVSLPSFSMAMGSHIPAFHLGIIAFSILYTPVSTLLGIGMNFISRRNEYEADSFAKKYSDHNALISGLEKLHTEQLGNVNPHPAYVFVHYSHPTLAQRIRQLNT